MLIQKTTSAEFHSALGELKKLVIVFMVLRSIKVEGGKGVVVTSPPAPWGLSCEDFLRLLSLGLREFPTGA